MHYLKTLPVLMLCTFSLTGCSTHCRTLSCTDLTDRDFAEMEALGVTLPDYLKDVIRYDYRDGLAVIFGLGYTLLPVPGTENFEIPKTRLVPELTDRSKVYFLDKDGNILLNSSYRWCFGSNDNPDVEVSTFFASVPDGLSFVLESSFGCTPAAARRIIHEYHHPDGTVQTIFDHDLNLLKNWRDFVVPVICENEICDN